MKRYILLMQSLVNRQGFINEVLNMKKSIGLIACSKRKNKKAVEDKGKKFAAEDLYAGNIFRQSKEYAQSHCKDWLILSAKHHLLDRKKGICYYDCYLGNKTASERKKWADKVLDSLKKKFDLRKEHFVIFGGKKYYENLCEHLNCSVYKCYSGGIYLDKPIKEYRNGGK
ncbi:hypothetical protein SAMN05720472_2622 [Fibrobacter sp. UWR3]|nr:hypothetical protein SAMN05720472_2622 [Fibrobacter sp. UWR3]SOE75972.1 hypothetical protein SAMN05720781_1889 [Fibrobacter sp. UWT3]